MNDRKLFVPGVQYRINPDGSQERIPNSSRPQSRPNLTMTAASPGSGGGGGGRAGGIIMGAIAGGAKKYANDPEFRSQVNNAGKRIVKVFKSDEPSSSGGGVLSPAPNPARTKLDTGIRQTGIEKDYLTAEENVCATMHTSHVLYSFPASTGKIFDFFNKVSIVDAQTRAQDNVNWAIDITNKFNSTKLINAFNDLFYCLQVYYFAKSIDVYRDGAYNNNEAMHTLRSQFDFTTQYTLDQVARLLVRTALPPNMLEFCRYINSNYLSGDTPNCPIIKIVPISPTSGVNYLTTLNTALADCVTRLSDNNNREIFSVMNRSLKHWVLGDVTKLYDPPIETTYDKDFLTIFNNLPFRTNIAATGTAPYAPDSNTTIRYNSFTNHLDGIAFALTDIYDSTNSRSFSGMLSIPNSAGVSRFSYYAIGGVKGWYSSNATAFLRTSRQDTYVSDTTQILSPHYYGSDMVLNVNANMLAQSCLNTVDWWLSIDMIRNESIRNPSVTNRPNGTRRRK